MRGLYEEAREAAAALLSQTDTLVIYAYSKTDPEYERNLHFFVEHGVWEGDGCHYLIIVQQVSLPSLSSLSVRPLYSSYSTVNHSEPSLIIKTAVHDGLACNSFAYKSILPVTCLFLGKACRHDGQGQQAGRHLHAQDKGLFDSSTLPALPHNARYVFHENRCYDWGTFGWAINEGQVDAAKYRAFVFINSSVRGPFLPAYFPVRRVTPGVHPCSFEVNKDPAARFPALGPHEAITQLSSLQDSLAATGTSGNYLET